MMNVEACHTSKLIYWDFHSYRGYFKHIWTLELSIITLEIQLDSKNNSFRSVIRINFGLLFPIKQHCCLKDLDEDELHTLSCGLKAQKKLISATFWVRSITNILSQCFQLT